jgi:hypothetical protein
MRPTSAEKEERKFLEANKKEYKKLTRLFESILDLKRWGFHQSYTFISPKNFPSVEVIYDSEWCRVQFSLSGGDMPGTYELPVRYGRLHAPDNEAVLIWNGEKCLCWHNVNDALRFLDGLSPQEAVDQLHKQPPPVVEQFRQSELGKKLHYAHLPEWIIREEAAIWEFYGQRLFDLFDLRRPELWEEYTRFIKEYYKILDIKPGPGSPYPPRYKVC